VRGWYTIHMKRTNLVLDEKLLEEATRVLGLKTYSATVNKALEEAIRIQKVRSLHQFMGTNLWQGDLAEMREDNPRPQRHKAAR
jgi:Arc/MetJ family transcription regulator